MLTLAKKKELVENLVSKLSLVLVKHHIGMTIEPSCEVGNAFSTGDEEVYVCSKT